MALADKRAFVGICPKRPAVGAASHGGRLCRRRSAADPRVRRHPGAPIAGRCHVSKCAWSFEVSGRAYEPLTTVKHPELHLTPPNGCTCGSRFPERLHRVLIAPAVSFKPSHLRCARKCGMKLSWLRREYIGHMMRAFPRAVLLVAQLRPSGGSPPTCSVGRLPVTPMANLPQSSNNMPQERQAGRSVSSVCESSSMLPAFCNTLI